MRPRSLIDASAFAAIMVVMVGMFMALVGPECLCREIGADVPKVKHPVPLPGARREDAIIVTVTRDGKIFFGSDQMLPELLGPRMQRVMAGGAERRLYIRADARSPYGATMKVLYAAQSVGIRQVSFFAEKEGPLPY